MKTTLNAIWQCRPSPCDWVKLLGYLGKTQRDDDPLSIATVLDSNGLDDATWCLRAVTGNARELRLYAVWCARRVQHLNTDQRVEAALVAAEGFANGTVSSADMASAGAAAWGAAGDAAGVKVGVAQSIPGTEAAWARAAAGASAAGGDAGRSAAEAGKWALAWALNWAKDAAAGVAQAAELRRVCAEIDSRSEK